VDILIVTESCFGNTSRFAQAVAAGLASRGAEVSVGEAVSAAPAGYDLLLMGAPTHNMGLPGAASRRQAQSKGGRPPVSGVAEWLETLELPPGSRAAAFDTVTGTGFFSGSAAKKVAKILRRKHLEVISIESFLVGGTSGPPVEGELDRAGRWGASLV
jgi:flavorubredoxin